MIRLDNFYTRAAEDSKFAKIFSELASPTEKIQMNGIGFSSLCFTLKWLLDKQLITLTDEFYLQAVGTKVNGQDNVRLAKYYESFGFELLTNPFEVENLDGSLSLVSVDAPIALTKKYPLKSIEDAQFRLKRIPMITTVARVLQNCAVRSKHSFGGFWRSW